MQGSGRPAVKVQSSERQRVQNIVNLYKNFTHNSPRNELGRTVFPNFKIFELKEVRP